MMPLDYILHIAHPFAFYSVSNNKVWFARFKRNRIKSLFQSIKVVAIDMPDSPAKTFILIVSSLRIDESRDKPALRLCGRGANSNRREQQQHGQLRYLERRLRLGRRHGAQCRNQAKELDDEHENIEIQRHHDGIV